MINTLVVLAIVVFVCSKYAKTHALNVKAENKAIESAYNALIERKEFAQEAQEQDAETYKLAVKLAKRG